MPSPGLGLGASSVSRKAGEPLGEDLPNPRSEGARGYDARLEKKERKVGLHVTTPFKLVCLCGGWTGDGAIPLAWPSSQGWMARMGRYG